MNWNHEAEDNHVNRSLDIGANPSAEEAEEALDEGTKQVIDVVDAFRLNFMGDEASGTRLFGTKKDYQGQLKGIQSLCVIALGYSYQKFSISN